MQPPVRAYLQMCLFLIALFAGCSKPPPPAPESAQQATAPQKPAPPGIANPGNDFYLGANYPWLHYGHDFGVTAAWSHDGVSNPKSREQIREDIRNLREHGVRTVRWFVFCDGRASPEFDAEGNVTGLDRQFFEDMDAALAVARENGVRVMFVLFDYLLAEEAKVDNQVQLGGRAKLISDPVKRRSLIEKALVPMLQRYGRHPEIIAWDIMNEPEGAMAVTGGMWVAESVEPREMQTFVTEIVDTIHQHASQPVTIGSSSRGMLEHWRNANLDFHQFHYYDPMEGEYPLATPAASLALGKPCIVGELPTKNSKRPLGETLDMILDNGYSGAFPWSLNGTDESSGLREALPELKAWADRHKERLDKPAAN